MDNIEVIIQRLEEKIEVVIQQNDAIIRKIDEIIWALPQLKNKTNYSKAVEEYLDEFMKNDL